MKIAFIVHHFSIRGSEVAIYDYALYNEIILKNKSVIVVPDNYKNHRHYNGELIHCPQVEEKFRKTFSVLSYSSQENLNEILLQEDCNVLYHLKSGEKHDEIKVSIPYLVHCIFTCNDSHRHGNIYAAISSTISTTTAPIVPHICTVLPSVSENLRKELSIPTDALVFGRHGGHETFDCEIAKNTIKNIIQNNDHIYFLFVNTAPFINHPQVIYIKSIVNQLEKAIFINTCDAMLYGRKQGESFGLAIGEFTTMGKPIICGCKTLEHSNHLEVLGDTAIYYRDENDLFNILNTFDPKTAKKPINYAKIFNPRDVMNTFNKVFLEKYHNNKIKLKLLCNWTTTSDIHNKWQKLIGQQNAQFVQNNPDYWVILNKPPDNSTYDPKRTIVMGMEPDSFMSDRWCWFEDKSKFMYFLDENYMTNWEWWLSKDHEYLMNNSPDKNKGKIVSSIVSSQYCYPGHQLRINFLKEAEKELKFHIYGWDNKFNFTSYQGSLPDSKDEGLFPYKYTLAAENSSRQNYCMEKLIDGILAECLVFYWGCPNIAEFLEPESFVQLDINDINNSIRKIRQCVEHEEWEKRIHAIRKSKHLILTKYSFIPRILSLIKVHKLKKKTVNMDSRPEKWKYHLEQCKNAQVPNVERFSAIVGSSFDMGSQYIQKLFLFTQNFVGNNKNTNGIVGCALSHYDLWKQVVELDQPMLILEDDVTFQPHFIDRLGFFLNILEEKTNWDVLFLGFHGHEDNCDKHNIPYTYLTDTFHKTSLTSYKYMTKFGTKNDASGLHGGGTFAYLISPQGAQRLVKMVKDHKFYFPVDYQILECGLHYGLDILVCPHQLVTSPKFGLDTDVSDIQKI